MLHEFPTEINLVKGLSLEAKLFILFSSMHNKTPSLFRHKKNLDPVIVKSSNITIKPTEKRFPLQETLPEKKFNFNLKTKYFTMIILKLNPKKTVCHRNLLIRTASHTKKIR